MSCRTCESSCHCCQPEPIITWVPTTPEKAESILYGKALVGGHESNESPLWVIRSHYNGKLLPGYFSVKRKEALISWAGKAYYMNEIEVCCASPNEIKWATSCNGQISSNAIVGGHTDKGELLYIGRAHEQGLLIPGMIYPTSASKKGLFVAYEGKEIYHKEFAYLAPC